MYVWVSLYVSVCQRSNICGMITIFLQIRSKGQKFENDCIPMRDGGDLTSLTFFQLSNKFLSLFCKILEFRGSWAGAIFLDKVVIFFSVQYTFAPCLVLGPA